MFPVGAPKPVVDFENEAKPDGPDAFAANGLEESVADPKAEAPCVPMDGLPNAGVAEFDGWPKGLGLLPRAAGAPKAGAFVDPSAAGAPKAGWPKAEPPAGAPELLPKPELVHDDFAPPIVEAWPKAL